MSRGNKSTPNKRGEGPHKQVMNSGTHGKNEKSNTIQKETHSRPAHYCLPGSLSEKNKAGLQNTENQSVCKRKDTLPRLASSVDYEHSTRVKSNVGVERFLPSTAELTDEKIIYHLSIWLGQHAGENLARCFRSATLLPPVTEKSLSELDLGPIINNARLRHDVNFDKELHFRPNLDGQKGREKLKASKDYWVALHAELELYSLLAKNEQLPAPLKTTCMNRITELCQRRIPQIFTTIQKILKNLVPERDHRRVDERLDVGMLMQEIQKGVCDLVDLSEWLARLLKAHCAPMRDEWIDKMVERTKAAVETGRPDCIVEGFRELLGILEAMKLVSPAKLYVYCGSKPC
jgi:hypothetical protein